MKICVVYDCLYPCTVGGAERWYRNLALRLAGAGHDVTYLTMRQWPGGEPPELRGVKVIAVAPRMALYVLGRRRILPPITFGLGVLWHLAVHGEGYDIVHTASFPYFPLLAAGLVRRLRGYRLIVDWHEVWSREYWQEYLGLLGWLGVWIQSRCMRLRQEAFCFSRLHEARLRTGGLAGPVTVLRGQYEGTPDPIEPADPEPVTGAGPLVVFAGRLIPEKRATAVIPAFIHARAQVPELQCLICGDGPDHDEVVRQVESNALGAVAAAPGFVAQERVERALQSAVCLVFPSRREGYGLVVVEALARGTPVVVVDGPDNAAVELIEDGVNGFVAASAAPEVLGEALVWVYAGGVELRESTAAWFAQNAEQLSLQSSLEIVSRAYEVGEHRAGRT
jgi:glycosyltransferase involved in cell wall biosynthesis